MRQQSKRYQSRNQHDVKPRAVHPRNFELELESKLASDLSYFVRQELEYYNLLVTLLTPRLRAYPRDILNIKDKEKTLWEACAEHAIDPQKLIDNPLVTWPKHLQYLHKTLYDSTNQLRISPTYMNICAIAATPARLHASVRKSIAAEILKYMMGQADILLAAMKTDTMRAPMQMLQTHTVDSKRHLQIPKHLVKISYDESTDTTSIKLPYSNQPLAIPRYDLRDAAFKMLVVHAPHPTAASQRWQLDFRDGGSSSYLLSLTDYVERKRRL